MHVKIFLGGVVLDVEIELIVYPGKFDVGISHRFFGFYEYPGGKVVKPDIPRELSKKIDPVQLLAPCFISAAWCVTNGVGSIDDINKSLRLAYNWPKGIFEYLDDYDTLGIPLKMSSKNSADWYCDNIPDTVGINYYIYSHQRWGWHSEEMPPGVYDPKLEMTEGYQISTSIATKFTYIGM